MVDTGQTAASKTDKKESTLKSYMEKSLERQSIVQNKKSDAEVFGYVGQQGLDSLRVKYPDWNEKSSKEKSTIAKNSDPIMIAMAKDFKVMDYDAFEDKWSPLNEKNQLNEAQINKQMIYSERLYDRGIKKLNQQRLIDNEEKAQGAELGYATIYSNFFTNVLDVYAERDRTVPGVKFMNETAGVIAEALYQNIDEFVNKNVDVSTKEGLQHLENVDKIIQNQIAEFVRKINIEKFSRDVEFVDVTQADGTVEREYIDDELSSKPEKIRFLIQTDLSNKYMRIVNKIISASEKTPHKPSKDPLGLFD